MKRLGEIKVGDTVFDGKNNIVVDVISFSAKTVIAKQTCFYLGTRVHKNGKKFKSKKQVFIHESEIISIVLTTDNNQT